MVKLAKPITAVIVAWVLAFGVTAPALADRPNLEDRRSPADQVIHAPVRLLAAAQGLLHETWELLLRISAAPVHRDSSQQDAPIFTTKKEPEVDPLGDG